VNYGGLGDVTVESKDPISNGLGIAKYYVFAEGYRKRRLCYQGLA